KIAHATSLERVAPIVVPLSLTCCMPDDSDECVPVISAVWLYRLWLFNFIRGNLQPLFVPTPRSLYFYDPQVRGRRKWPNEFIRPYGPQHPRISKYIRAELIRGIVISIGQCRLEHVQRISKANIAIRGQLDKVGVGMKTLVQAVGWYPSHKIRRRLSIPSNHACAAQGSRDIEF